MTTSHPKHLIRQAAAVVSALMLGVLALVVPHSAGAADSPSASVTVTGATAADGLTVNIDGTGFTGLPNASTGAPASGVYAALRDPATTTNDDINANPSAAPAFNFVPNAAISSGSFTLPLTADAADLDPDGTYEVIVWVAHGNITPATLLTTTPVTLTPEQHAALFG